MSIHWWLIGDKDKDKAHRKQLEKDASPQKTVGLAHVLVVRRLSFTACFMLNTHTHTRAYINIELVNQSASMRPR